MKNTCFIVLLAILFMQTGGGLQIYKIQQYCVQREMEQALNNEGTLFQQLTLSLSDFQKGEINADEISINGKMYDIKSLEIRGDKVELLVINDTREENILEDIKKSINSSNQQNKEHPYHFVKVLTLLYITPVTDNIFLLEKNKQNIFRSPCEIIISYKPGISSPPPRLV